MAYYLISEIEIVSAETWVPLRNRLRTAYEAVDPPYAVNDPERRVVIGFLLEFFEDESDEPEYSQAMIRTLRGLQ